MTITEVRVFPHRGHDRCLAFASITIDGSFAIRGLKIIRGERGIFVAMPTRLLPTGVFQDVAHPINRETRLMVETAVLDEYDSRWIKAWKA